MDIIKNSFINSSCWIMGGLCFCKQCLLFWLYVFEILQICLFETKYRILVKVKKYILYVRFRNRFKRLKMQSSSHFGVYPRMTENSKLATIDAKITLIIIISAFISSIIYCY